MKALFFLLAACCVVVSCSTKTGDPMPETRNITHKDFKEHRLEYEILPIEVTDFVWTMSTLDTLAFFFNESSDDAVPVYDLKNNRRVGAVFRRGRGPNDLVGFSSRVQMNTDKGFAAVLDGAQNMFMVFPLEVLTRMASGDTNHVFTPYAKFCHDEIRFSDISALDTNVFVGLPFRIPGAAVAVDHRFVFYYMQDNLTVEKGGYYRSPEMTFPEEMNAFAFNGKLINRNDGKRIVIPNELTDRIEIYDGQGDLIRLVRGPDHFDPDVVKISKGNMISYNPGEKYRYAYLYPVAKEGGFWAIYYGASYEECMALDAENRFTSILSFDWDGNPLDKYIIPADVRFFGVDESRGLIYGIIMTEEGEQKIIKAKYK